MGTLCSAIFLLFAASSLVSFILAQTQQRMLRFTVQLQYHVRSHLPVLPLVAAHLIDSLVFVPIMLGVLFFLFEFFADQLLAFLVLLTVWLCELWSVTSCRTLGSLRVFPRVFGLTLTWFLVYYLSYPFGYQYLALAIVAMALVSTIFHLWARYELPALTSGTITARQPRAPLVAAIMNMQGRSGAVFYAHANAGNSGSHTMGTGATGTVDMPHGHGDAPADAGGVGVGGHHGPDPVDTGHSHGEGEGEGEGGDSGEGDSEHDDHGRGHRSGIGAGLRIRTGGSAPASAPGPGPGRGPTDGLSPYAAPIPPLPPAPLRLPQAHAPVQSNPHLGPSSPGATSPSPSPVTGAAAGGVIRVAAPDALGASASATGGPSPIMIGAPLPRPASESASASGLVAGRSAAPLPLPLPPVTPPAPAQSPAHPLATPSSTPVASGDRREAEGAGEGQGQAADEEDEEDEEEHYPFVGGFGWGQSGTSSRSRSAWT